MRKRRLELDHVAGDTQCELTITICNFDCHVNKTTASMGWDSRCNLTTNSDNISASFLVQGTQELLRQKFRLTKIDDYMIMADSLSPIIKYYRDRA
jgi:hypothetical protein